MALGDSADRPIYIETVARRGYRYVAPVEGDRTVPSTAKTAAPRRRVVVWLAVSGFAIGVVLVTGLWPIDVPQVERVVPLTNDTTLKAVIGRLISDGNRVLYGDGNDIWSVPATGGQPKRLSLPFLHNALFTVLADYSPIQQQILLVSGKTGKSGQIELWLAGTEGESPHKIAELNQPSIAALAPDDGKRFFYLGGERRGFPSSPGGIPGVAEEVRYHPADRQRAVSFPSGRRSYERQAALFSGKRPARRNRALRPKGPTVGFLPGRIFRRKAYVHFSPVPGGTGVTAVTILDRDVVAELRYTTGHAIAEARVLVPPGQKGAQLTGTTAIRAQVGTDWTDNTVPVSEPKLWFDAFQTLTPASTAGTAQ